jgi:hypothetical protein
MRHENVIPPLGLEAISRAIVEHDLCGFEELIRPHLVRQAAWALVRLERALGRLRHGHAPMASIDDTVQRLARDYPLSVWRRRGLYGTTFRTEW